MLLAWNNVQAVATVAAHPMARNMLREADVVRIMQGIVVDGPSTLIASAKSAIAAVEWEP